MKKLFVLLLTIFSLFLASCDINFANNNNNNSSTDKKEEAVYSKAIQPSLVIDSIDKINYSIENVCDKIVECSIQILDSDGDIFVVYDKLNGSIRELNNNEKYKLSGYYMGYIDNTLYKVNIEEAIINTASYNDVLKIQRSTCVSNIYSNLFVVDTKPFIDAAPEGYSFQGITVTEKGGEPKDIDYTGQDTICVKDLKPSTTYSIGSYYDKISVKSKLKMSNKLNDVTPGYRIRFVGFWVVSGDTSANKVDMVYNNEILYTYYIEDGGSLYNPYNFILPEKYKGYYVVGSDKKLENITTDLVCNLILALENPTTSFLVVFYDFKGNIFHSETVELGKAAVGPATTPENYTVGDITYEFDKWDKDYSNITANTKIYPVKKDNTPKEEIPVIEFNNTLISNKYISGGFQTKDGAKAIISSKVYLKDTSDNITDIANETDGYVSFFTEYDQSLKYELHYEIEYKLDNMTESAYITKTQIINFANMALYDKGNYSFDAAHETNRSMHIKVRYDDIDMIVRYVKVNDYVSNFHEYIVKDNLAIVDGLYPGYKYNLNYAFKDNNDEYLYYVSNSTFEIETMSKAEFGLESVSIEYFTHQGVSGNQVLITFVGDKAYEFLSNENGVQIHAQIIENMEHVEVNFDTSQIQTVTDDGGNKYAYVYGEINTFNYETGQWYEFGIGQITLLYDDEVFYYFSNDYKQTETGYVDYFEPHSHLIW